MIVVISIAIYLIIGITFVVWACKDDHSGYWLMFLPFLAIVVFTWPYWLVRWLVVGDK